MSNTQALLRRGQGLTVPVLALLLLLGLSARVYSQAYTTGQPATEELLLGQGTFDARALGPVSAQSMVPTAVAIDPTNGKVFVMDADRYRILRFASISALNVGAAAEGVLGQPNFTARLHGLAANRFTALRALAFDAEGNLYVADGKRVLRFHLASLKTDGAPADAVLGQSSYEAQSNTVDQATTVLPTGLVVTASGALFVADAGGRRILRYDNARAKSDGAAADGVLGQPDFTSSGVQFPPSGFSYPAALALDAQGRLYAADQARHCVLRFDAAATKANGAAAEGMLGIPGASCPTPDVASVPAATAMSCMGRPSGLAVDIDGRLFVAAANDHRVLVFDNAATKPSGAAADAILGQGDMRSQSAAAGLAGIYNPMGLAADLSDARGRVLVSDVGNHRVIAFRSNQTTAVETPRTPSPLGPLTAGPNPLGALLELNVSSERAINLTVEAYNLLGQPVLRQPWALSPGPNRLELATTQWTQGLYLLRLIEPANGQVHHRSRLVKR